MVLLCSIMQIQILTKVCFKLSKNLQMLCRIHAVQLLLKEVNAVYVLYVYTHTYICTFFSCVADWPHRRTAREERGLSSVLCAHSVRLEKTNKQKILNLSIAHSSCKTGFLAKANAAASL